MVIISMTLPTFYLKGNIAPLHRSNITHDFSYLNSALSIMLIIFVMSDSSSVLMVSECCSRLWATLTVCNAVDLWACLTIDRSSAPVMLTSVTSIVMVTSVIRSTSTEPTTALYRVCRVMGLATDMAELHENMLRTPPNMLSREMLVDRALICTSSTRSAVAMLLPPKRSAPTKVMVLQPDEMWWQLDRIGPRCTDEEMFLPAESVSVDLLRLASVVTLPDLVVANCSPVLELNATLPFEAVWHPGSSMALLLMAMLSRLVRTMLVSLEAPPMLMSSRDTAFLPMFLVAIAVAGVHTAVVMFPIRVVLPIVSAPRLLLAVTTLISHWDVSVLFTARPVSVVLAVTAVIRAMLTSSVALAVVM